MKSCNGQCAFTKGANLAMSSGQPNRRGEELVTKRSNQISRLVLSFCLPLMPLASACSQEKPQVSAELTASVRQELSADALYMSRIYAKWSKESSTKQMPIDLTDPSQYGFVVRRLRASGNTQQNSPQLFARLEQARAKAIANKERGVTPQSTIEWCGHILSLAERAGASSGTHRFEQRGLVTCRDGSQYAIVDTNAYWSNPAGSEYILVGSASNENYETTLLETPYLNTSFAPMPGRILVVDSMSLAFNDTDDHLTFTTLEDAIPDRPASLRIDEPVERIGGPPIRTCLERGSAFGNLDCDYASVNKQGVTIRPFTRPYTGMSSINVAASNAQGQWVAEFYWPPPAPYAYNETKLYQPIKGSFDPGAAHGGECTIDALSVPSRANIVLVDAGGRCSGTTPGTTVATAALTWSPPVPGVNMRYFNGLVDFGTDCLGYQQDVKLVISIDAEAKCGNVTGVRRPFTHEDIIIDFKNSCLAEGTQVLRADGSASAIEKIQVGDKVLANERGQSLTVTTISKGIESRKMIRLRDAEGRDVLVTSKHPLITDTGKVLAAEALKAGDLVQAGNGTTRLTSVEQVAYDGQVYNLTLGTAEELAKISNRERTMVANGFLVGDNEMQADLERREHKQPADVLARLSKPWHQDYKNDLARKQGKRKGQH